jgi:hypothetical protein
MQMMTASECRQQSTRYMDDAKIEEHVGIRTTLLALNRSCLMLTNQIERLAAMREAEGRRA